MWILSAIFLALWVLSVHFYFPVLVILALFAGMLITAGMAMLPAEERIES
jgi:hypothetical protein